MNNKQTLLRKLPAINIILEQDRIKQLDSHCPHVLISEAASETVQGIREAILTDENAGDKITDLDSIVDIVIEKVRQKTAPNLRKVINATGIVLHTNLGRAVLAKSAVKAINDVAANYSNLELDLTTGQRGTRYSHIEELLCRLTGAEAGMVVNNNAAAVLLVLNTLAKNKEVVVSRGQLVEIGGSFRIPEVMSQSGAVLAEVGTTNKTYLRDYESAITGDTALLLKVHTSNYKVIGFTAEASVEELVSLGTKRGIAVYEDLGSGVLVQFTKYGIPHEPTVSESIKAGVDIVTCSGDKLFGGPQAGIIVGRKNIIDKIKQNQLTRALRVDKFTLAAMEATLRLYFDEEAALAEIPTLRMIMMKPEEIKSRAENLLNLIREKAGAGVETEIIAGFSQVGGGALPEADLPTFLVSVKPLSISVNKLEQRFREMELPVLARIQKDRLLFDLRTLFDKDSEIIAINLQQIIEMG
ncbi:L-seryl-tRNA(Sec) selenium transferase [Phosphitispora sp. TUW77]|uniref:L-seryl-tRNA(Sec) selenium transferase n=1 Tax=Phosphitispora sp. TUW77 TaxID=3152361 RepID=UPI003AB55331